MDAVKQDAIVSDSPTGPCLAYAYGGNREGQWDCTSTVANLQTGERNKKLCTEEFDAYGLCVIL